MKHELQRWRNFMCKGYAFPKVKMFKSVSTFWLKQSDRPGKTVLTEVKDKRRSNDSEDRLINWSYFFISQSVLST